MFFSCSFVIACIIIVIIIIIIIFSLLLLVVAVAVVVLLLLLFASRLGVQLEPRPDEVASEFFHCINLFYFAMYIYTMYF